MDRMKLDTMLEREAFAYIDMIKEHTIDFTMLYVKRNGIDVDLSVVERVLRVVQNAIEDGKMSKIEFFKKGVDKYLDAWTDTENPLPPTKERKKPRE